MSDQDPLSSLSDEELGQVVRDTPVFRLAIACAEFQDSVAEIRESDEIAWERLIDDTLDNQTRVRAKASARDVIDGFLEAIESYARLARKPEELTAEAAKEAAEELE